MEFPGQEYWSGLPFPSPGNLADPGIKPASPALADGFFTTEPLGKPEYIVSAVLIIDSLYHVEITSIPNFWRIFITNGYWILSKAFSASVEIIILFLSFNSMKLICCIILIDLQILKNPCIPGIKSTWSRCVIFIICAWILKGIEKGKKEGK